MWNDLFPPPDRDDDAGTGESGLLRALNVLALGTVLVLAWRACSTRHRHRRTARSARTPAPVQTWESEGGRPLPDDHAVHANAAVKAH